jgi:hypothetical protein
MPTKHDATGETEERDARKEAFAAEDCEEAEVDGGGTDPLDRAETIARLEACVARLGKAHAFAPGQLVRWKKGLKNRMTPAYGEPLVVIRNLQAPVFDPAINDSGNPYFREPLTLIAGELAEDGGFFCYHYDARRLEPYRGS